MTTKIRFAAFALSVLCLLFFTGCDNTDDYHTPNVSTVSTSAQDNTTALDSVDAPPLKEGTYSMCCTFKQSADYSYGGSSYMNTDWNIGSWYSAALSKNDDGYTIKLTITRKNYTYNYNGEDAVLYDTEDKSTLAADTKVYFDMVGQSFTAVYDKDMKLTAINGAEKIYEKYPDMKTYLPKNDLKAVAQELVLELPAVINKDTVLSHTQVVDDKSTLNMKYVPGLLAPATLKFTMTTDNDFGLPESEQGDGYTVTYTGAEEYTGTLYIDAADRMVQSTSNSITYHSVMDVDQSDGSVAELDGRTVITDTCEVTKEA